jgi:hypothetical protein
MIDARRYTSGSIAIANLSASVDSLELRRVEGASFEELVALSTLLFVRGDLLGRIADYDRARSVRAQAALLGLSSVVAVGVGGFCLSDAWFILRWL